MASAATAFACAGKGCLDAVASRARLYPSGGEHLVHQGHFAVQKPVQVAEKLNSAVVREVAHRSTQPRIQLARGAGLLHRPLHWVGVGFGDLPRVGLPRGPLY